jgi:hypothetical protein
MREQQSNSLKARLDCPWGTAMIELRWGPDEWLVTIEDRAYAVLEDGAAASAGTADDDVHFPQCYRDSSEIRVVPPADGRPR